MRESLLALLLSGPLLADVPMGWPTVMGDLTVTPMPMGLPLPGLPALPGTVPGKTTPSLDLDMLASGQQPAKVIVFATISTADGLTKKYSVIADWSTDQSGYSHVIIPLKAAPTAVVSLMIATVNQEQMHAAK